MLEMLDGDREHPLMPDAFRWELVEFTYRTHATDWREAYIDLVFRRDDTERRLRFFGPQDLRIPEGLPNSSGMSILDVTARQLDGLRVLVKNFEDSYGAPTFWAADVVEITDAATAGVGEA
jgi:hypothetical protein